MGQTIPQEHLERRKCQCPQTVWTRLCRSGKNVPFYLLWGCVFYTAPSLLLPPIWRRRHFRKRWYRRKRDRASSPRILDFWRIISEKEGVTATYCHLTNNRSPCLLSRKKMVPEIMRWFQQPTKRLVLKKGFCWNWLLRLSSNTIRDEGILELTIIHLEQECSRWKFFDDDELQDAFRHLLPESVV